MPVPWPPPKCERRVNRSKVDYYISLQSHERRYGSVKVPEKRAHTHTPPPPQHAEKKFEQNSNRQQCRKVFAFQQTCVHWPLIMTLIRCTRARLLAHRSWHCGQSDLPTITDYTCAKRGDDAYICYLLRESFG